MQRSRTCVLVHTVLRVIDISILYSVGCLQTQSITVSTGKGF